MTVLTGQGPDRNDMSLAMKVVVALVAAFLFVGAALASWLRSIIFGAIRCIWGKNQSTKSKSKRVKRLCWLQP